MNKEEEVSTKRKNVRRKPITKAERQFLYQHDSSEEENEDQNFRKCKRISWEGFPTRVHQIKEGTYSGVIVSVTIDEEDNTITVTADTEDAGQVSKSYQVEYYGDTSKVEINTPLYYFLKAMGAVCSSGKIEWKVLIGKKVNVVVGNNNYVQSIKPYKMEAADKDDSLEEEDDFYDEEEEDDLYDEEEEDDE